MTALRPELKRKLIEVERGSEELILKAKFEEVKGRELTAEKTQAQPIAKMPRSTGGATSLSLSTTQTVSVTTGPSRTSHSVHFFRLGTLHLCIMELLLQFFNVSSPPANADTVPCFWPRASSLHSRSSSCALRGHS